MTHIICVAAQAGDELTWVAKCSAGDTVLLAASDGMAIRHFTDQARSFTQN